MGLKVGCEQKIPGCENGWEVLSIEFEVQEMTQKGKQSLEFENCTVQLTSEQPLREIYFHEEGCDEGELSYFSIELNSKRGTVFVSPGNCDAESIGIDNISLLTQESGK